MKLTVLVVHICLLLNAATILIVVVLIVIVMMLLSTAVSLSDILCKINKFTKKLICSTSRGKIIIGICEMYNCIYCLLQVVFFIGFCL